LKEIDKTRAKATYPKKSGQKVVKCCLNSQDKQRNTTQESRYSLKT